MQLAQPAGTQRHEPRGNVLVGEEGPAVGDLHCPACVLPQERLALQRKIERVFRGAFAAHYGYLVGSERSRQLALEDVPIVQWYFRERIGWDAEILGQDIGWGVREKISHQKRSELGCLAAIEGDDEFGAVGTQALQ